MNEKNVGISQETLVFNTEDVPAKKLPQYIASLSATLGALTVGTVLGWTAVAGADGQKLIDLYNINMTSTDFSWIGSLTTLGAAAICIPIGILADIIGRKYTMLLMVIPLTLGWLLLIFANSLTMFFIGRLILGFTVGAFCVTIPMYIAEIAESEIRGRLGSYFQLLLAIGVSFVYVLGSFVNMRELSIISAVVPFIFFGTFMFMPETPMYYLKKGNEEGAKKSLTKLRGTQYNVENELRIHRESLEESRAKTTSLFVLLKSKAVKKSFVISYGLMIFQQLSGVNVSAFYAGTLLAETGDSMFVSYSISIMGIIQIFAIFISTLVVDHLGRRILLMVSAIFMCLTTLAIGVYFYLTEIGEDVSEIKWLPIISICLFGIMFSIGFGPLPWMMMGEVFAPEVKGVAASGACVLNWLLAFIVTKFFDDLKQAINVGPTYWLFSVICAIGTLFVYIFVPETKGKSLVEIQRELNTS